MGAPVERHGGLAVVEGHLRLARLDDGAGSTGRSAAPGLDPAHAEVGGVIRTFHGGT